MHVEVVFDLVEGAVFVPEEAALAVGAEQRLREGGARFGLVLLVVGRGRLAQELVVPVSELALASVPAETHLNPVFAQLCLVLGLVYIVLVLFLRPSLALRRLEELRRVWEVEGLAVRKVAQGLPLLFSRVHSALFNN